MAWLDGFVRTARIQIRWSLKQFKLANVRYEGTYDCALIRPNIAHVSMCPITRHMFTYVLFEYGWWCYPFYFSEAYEKDCCKGLKHDQQVTGKFSMAQEDVLN